MNKNSSGFAIWQYLSALYFFGNDYLFYPFFVVWNTDVRYRSYVKWSFNSCHCFGDTPLKSRVFTLPVKELEAIFEW